MRFLSDLLAKAGLIVDGTVRLNSIANATTDTDKFLVSDGGFIKYRTGTQLLTDIGAQPAGTYVTSVGLTMPSAFNVANSPITGAGTLAVTGAGFATQYIRGDGQLATLPSFAGGGSSVNYYLNGSINASVGGYKQLSMNAIIGTGTNFTLGGNGLIAQFLTDVNDPNRIQIPGGSWNFEMYFSSSSNGGAEGFYVELLKYDGTTFTSIASSSTNPESITGGTSTDLYITSLAVPTTTLLATDRLAIRVYIVNNAAARTVTLKTEDNNLCEIITTFAGGIASLNGLTANTQYLATGTSGTDFNISSVGETHTFNLPTASSVNRGALSNTDWITFNSKVAGTGTTNYIPKWTSGSGLGNSLIYDNGNVISIGTNATLVQTLNINSTYATQSLNSISGNFAYVSLLNGATGGGFFIGAEGSTGGTFGTGSTAYAGVLSRLGAYNLQFATNNVVGMTLFSTGNLALNSTTDNGNRLQVTGNGYFSGDLGIGIVSPLTVTNYRSLDIRGTTGGLIEMGNTTNQITGRFIEIEATQSIAKFMAFNSVPLVLGTQGQERMRIDTSGNIGLGVTPSAWTSYVALEIGKAGNSIFGYNGAELGLTSNAYYSTGWKYGGTGLATLFSNAAGVFAWYNAPSGTAGAAISFVQRMTLTAAGRLLLGTTSDNGARLQVTGETRLDGELFVTGSTGYIQVGTGSLSKISIESTGTTGIIGTRDASDFALRTNLITRLTIASTGAATFSSSVEALRYNATSSSASLVGYAVTAGNGMFNAGTNIVGFSTASTERMRITSGGNVNIIADGTNSTFTSDGVLAIKRANGAPYMSFHDDNGSRIGYIQMQASGGAAIGNEVAQPFAFFTNSTERMRINSGGNLLVGTTVDSGYKLDVNGTGRFVNASTFQGIFSGWSTSGANSASAAISLGNTAAYRGVISYAADGDTTLSFDNSYDSAGAIMRFRMRTAGTAVNALSIAGTGAATFSSSVTATSFVKTSGTSAQFLKADGSVDSSSYILLTSLSATSPLSYNNLTGAFTISQASSSFNGYLSSTDWITFNSKIGGSGSTGYIPKFTSASAIGNSQIFEAGTNVLIGTTVDSGEKLVVSGSVKATEYNLSALNTAPATSSSTGTVGQIRIDANHIYVCTATNTWKRVAIATF